MKTQNINTPAPFFTPGTRYRCTRTVVMNKKNRATAFKAGQIYEQAANPSPFVGWLVNDGGESHGWPQPSYIATECKTWGWKPADIDPRNYFEPVSE